MASRFDGRDGKRELAAALARQELVQHDDVIASTLAEHALVAELPQGEQLYAEGEPSKKCLFFILSGRVELCAEDQVIATLESGQVVGEFPVIDPRQNYTVTARAQTPSVMARVTEDHFLSIAAKHPELWRNMARMLMKRLQASNEARTSAGAAQALPAQSR